MTTTQSSQISSTPATRVAVLGTGVMGAGMARSLLAAGLDVTVWNRTTERATPLAEDGARVAETATDAVKDVDAVLTMLFDIDSVLAVMDEVADAVGPDTVWVQSSTIGVAGAARVAELAERRGLRVVDAPVLGTRQPAETGTLVVLAAAARGLRPRVAPVLDAIGARTVWVGEQVGEASALKLACNAWVATVTAGVAQSLALTQAFGLDPNLFLQAIEGGPLDLKYAHVKGAAMTADEFPVAFALDGLVKDLELIVGAGRDAGLDPALAESVRDLFQRASDEGLGDEDIAAVHRLLSTRTA